jgi:thiamine-phosphate pyrophosphorylase
MAESCLLYYITDRTAFAGDEPTRRRRLLEKIAEATRAGVDYIQLREKDLSTREVESLAREAMTIIRESALTTENRELRTALLINSRADVALAVGADGVHLRSTDLSPQEIQMIWKCGTSTLARHVSPQSSVTTVSCHSPEEVIQAATQAATFAVFAPVFEKKDIPGAQPAGLTVLGRACKAHIPVIALGGITPANARSCLAAGAAGIAAIRLFQENNIAEIVERLRQKL